MMLIVRLKSLHTGSEMVALNNFVKRVAGRGIVINIVATITLHSGNVNTNIGTKKQFPNYLRNGMALILNFTIGENVNIIEFLVWLVEPGLRNSGDRLSKMCSS